MRTTTGEICMCYISYTSKILAEKVDSNEMWGESIGWSKAGARFSNDFLPAIQIRWKLRLAVILLLAIRSQQNVQNFVAITVLKSRWEWNKISIEFELRWKNL